MKQTRPVEPLDPSFTTRVADRFDRYERLMRLAEVFDNAGDQLRERSRLGAQVLRDPAFADSADLSASTHRQVEDDVRGATTGKQGLLLRSVELDADALVVRATVLTYQWIDDLRDVAYETLGAIAGRAIGYLAPEVALGGAVVAAGLIETDALDRDGVAAYLGELAGDNPELMDHVTSGGGGLLDGLQMRAVLTAGALSGDPGRQVARAGLRALGADVMRPDSWAAVRDVAGGLLRADAPGKAAGVFTSEAPFDRPTTMAELMRNLLRVDRPLLVQRTAPHRYLGYVGPQPASSAQAGAATGAVLVGTDEFGVQVDSLARALATAVDGDAEAHLMLIGAGAGGALAARVAVRASEVGPSCAPYVVDTVVTAGAPAAQVPRLPASVRTLALEDRADPVALLGSLINASQENRTTVVFDAAGTSTERRYVAGGRAADADGPPRLVAEIQRLRDLGYLG